MAAPPVLPSISRLTSGYGVRPGRSSGAPTYHAGADFRASRGDPVFAVADGTVDFVATDRAPRGTRGYGNVVAIAHPGGFWSMYAHLSRVDVAEGDGVVAGQQIGAAGNTTNGKFRGMGAHLHFEVRTAAVPGPYRTTNVDPVAWLLERGVDVRGRDILIDRGRGGREPTGGLSGLLALTEQHGARPIFSALRGLGGPVDAATLDLGAPGLPDEPLRDPWTFDPPNAGVYVLLTSTVGAIGAAAFAIWRRR